MKFLLHTALLVVLFFAAAFQVSASSKKDNIYAFAYGTSFNDSTIYLSAVSHLSIASIDKKSHLLNDRSGYSAQFKAYLDKLYAKDHTCTIFFSTNRKKLEKKYEKLRRFCRKDKEVKVVEISSGDFTLQ